MLWKYGTLQGRVERVQCYYYTLKLPITDLDCCRRYCLIIRAAFNE